MDALIDTVGSMVGVVVGGIVVNALFNELVDRQPQFLTWCLSRVARLLPEEERPIRIEEWAADLRERPTDLSKLYSVCSFALAAYRIARDIHRERQHTRATLVRVASVEHNTAEVRKAAKRVSKALDAKLAKLRADIDACAWGEERARKVRDYEAVSQQIEEQALKQLREQLNNIGKR